MDSKDFSLHKVKDISRTDVIGIIDELITELHLDCSQKIDESVYPHTVKKFVELVSTMYKSWCVGEIRSVMRNGITGVYGGKNERINFQTLSTWMKRAQAGRATNFSERSVYDAHELPVQTVKDFGSLSDKWKEFREWMRGEGLWFIDNISELNCNMYHAARKSGSLREFREMLVHEPDPEYFEQMKRMTLEEFKMQHESEKVFS
jgi:hypothetical protein